MDIVKLWREYKKELKKDTMSVREHEITLPDFMDFIVEKEWERQRDNALPPVKTDTKEDRNHCGYGLAGECKYCKEEEKPVTHGIAGPNIMITDNDGKPVTSFDPVLSRLDKIIGLLED